MISARSRRNLGAFLQWVVAVAVAVALVEGSAAGGGVGAGREHVVGGAGGSGKWAGGASVMKEDDMRLGSQEGLEVMAGDGVGWAEAGREAGREAEGWRILGWEADWAEAGRNWGWKGRGWEREEVGWAVVGRNWGSARW